MSNIPISSLPVATSIDGTELVPIVQGGTTKHTTIGNISTFPATGASFVTATVQSGLTQSRLLSPQAGVLTVTDGGPLSTITVGVLSNGIGNTQLRQGTALSVIGNATNATANVADIAATNDNQILRRSGTSIGFGSIDLSQANAVGASILRSVNGGTGVNNGSNTLTLGGSLTTAGAFSSTFTMTGATAVTFPTSGTLATTAGASIPSVAQGDLLFGSAANVLSALPKNTTATRYLANTGTSNNPNWDQVSLTTGVTGILPFANGGTNANLTASNGGIFWSTASAGAILAGTATARQMLQSGATASPAWSTTTWPATSTINRILFSSAANVIGEISTVNGGIISANSSGVPASTVTPVLGVAGASTGTIGLSGLTSGVVTIQPQSAAGTYNFNLPTSAGTSGQPLLSGGGVSSPMTFGTLGVVGGGTGLASITAHDLIIGNGTSAATLLAPSATSGVPLISQGASSDPAYGTAVVAGGGTGATSFTAFAVLCGGTTSTGPVQPVASVGTSGQVLTSNGAGALPTFQTVSGTGTVTNVATAGILTGGPITTTGTLNVNASITPQGRLTLVTATPVMTTTQSAKTTILYTPYQGNMVPIYDGTNMVPTAVAEISVATTDTTKSPAAIGASKVNDWFVWDDSGTKRIGHGPDWTNDTTRSAGTALVMVNGILLNNASITNGPAAQRGTYVGTTRSNGSSQLDYIFGAAASGGTAGFFGVWNAYNRVMTSTTVVDNGTTYTYSSATIRQARASAGNQISFVVGLSEDGAQATTAVQTSTAAVASSFAQYGIGFDSTSAFINSPTLVFTNAAASNVASPLAGAVVTPTIGFHFFSCNQVGDGTNTSTFGAPSPNLPYLNATIRN